MPETIYKPYGGNIGSEALISPEGETTRNRVEQAADVLAIVETTVPSDEVDGAVAAMVGEAIEGNKTGVVDTPDAVAAETVGMLEVLDGGTETALAVNEAPRYISDPAARDIATVGGDKIIEVLAARLAAAEDVLTDSALPTSQTADKDVWSELLEQATTDAATKHGLTGDVKYRNATESTAEIVAPLDKGAYRKLSEDSTVVERFGRKFPPDAQKEYGQLERLYDVLPNHVAKPVKLVYDEKGKAVGYDAEEVKGETLEDLLGKGKLQRSDITQLEIIVRQLHHAGMFHGDLSANNLIQQENGLIKLVDPVSVGPYELTADEIAQLQEDDMQKIEDLRKNVIALETEAAKSAKKAEVHQLIADLQDDRRKIGDNWARTSNAYERQWFDDILDDNAETLLKDERVDAIDKIMLLDEMYRRLAHITTLEAKGMHFGSLGRPQRTSLQEGMGCNLQLIPSETLVAMKHLPKSDRGMFDFIVKEALEGANDKNKKILLAKLGGYENLTEKFVAIQAGKEKDDGLSRLDTLYDLEADPSKFESLQTTMTNVAFDSLTYDTGLSRDQASEIIAALHGRSSRDVSGDDKTLRLVDPAMLRDELERCTDAVSHVGIENALRLREQCGIVNFSEMSKKQLDRMVKFMDGDEELLDDLRNKEVCVILRDATADWNGALKGMNDQYETNDGATLIFEISSLRDGGKQMRGFMDMLSKANVCPSVLVIAGHGSPGSVYMGSGDNEGRIIPIEPRVTPKGDTVTLADVGLDNLIGNMKPDRDGNCTIVYESCSQAADLASPDDTTLSRTAEVVREKSPGKVYHIHGIRNKGNIKMNRYGELQDFSKQPITSVIVGKYGGVYVYDTDPFAPALPMFNKTKGIDLRKKPQGYISTSGEKAA